MTDSSHAATPAAGWSQRLAAAVAVYARPRLIAVLLVGFSQGLPLALTGSTVAFWLREEGISLAAIGLFALVALPYTFKFVWAPLIDQLPLPFMPRRFGRRRGWALTMQAALIAALIVMGLTDPASNLTLFALLAVAVAFFSASQDIVTDAWRVELLEDDQLAAGAAMVVSGYRIGMLASGAGALYLASVLPWSMVYVIMGAGILVGMATILAMPEPLAGTAPATGDRPEGGGRAGRRPAAERLAAWFARAFVGPFSEFMARRGWVAFLLFAVLYKLGDSMAGHMATPLYVDLGFDKVEVANYAKVLGTAATFGGLFVGGALMRGLGLGPTLWIAGIAQALSNLTFAALALVGHQDWMLATAIGVENLTGGVGTAALVAYFSLLCNVQFTATQFALLSAFASAARTFLTAPTGWLVEDLGWVHYFVVTTLAAAPGLAVLLWITIYVGFRRPGHDSKTGQDSKPEQDSEGGVEKGGSR